MASINKLSIRGVRSFSPEDSEQVLEFFFPVTIIVGANGCGKTTIIESLKYAITGGLPPGARSGQSFVHDARSLNQTSVKASVKLRFTSKAGQGMVVVRSMELTQKKTTASFKQLDGVIRTMDPRTGERKALSHKCSELDKQVPQLMGVSKAILDYVLFCHQEDSSWPLQEGATLKKRFDDIFDSTRYTKAVDVMRKKEKALIAASKDIKAELASYKSHRHAANGFRAELEKYQEALEELDEQKVDLKKKMEKTDAEMSKYQGIIEKVDEIQNELERFTGERHQQEMIVQKQREMLEQDLTQKHSLGQLRAMLKDFDQTRQEQIDQLDALKETQAQIMREIDNLRQEEQQWTKRTTQLEVEKEANEENMRSRYQLMESMVQTHGLDLDLLSQNSVDQSFTANMSMVSSSRGMSQDSVVTITPEDMQGFLDAVEKKQQELQSRLTEQKERTKTTDGELYATIGDLQRKIDAIDSDLKRLGNQKAEYNSEQLELARKVSAGSRTRKSDVEEARKKADALARQRDEANNDPRRNEIPVEIRAIEDKVDKLKREIEDDRISLQALRYTADAQNAIGLLRDQCSKDLEALEESVRDQTSTFQKFNIPTVTHLPAEDDNGDDLQQAVEKMVDAIRNKYEDSHGDYTKVSDEVVKTQQIVSEKNALLSSNQANLNALKSKIQKLADGSVTKVRKVAQDLRRHEASLELEPVRATEETPRELLDYLNKRLTALDDDSPMENAGPILRKLMKRLKKLAKVEDGHFECPCCRRAFEQDENAPNYVHDVQLFQDTIAELSSDESPLLSVNPQYQETRANYEGWKKVVAACMDDLRDYQRMTKEVAETEKEHQRLVDDASHFQSKLRSQKNDKLDLESVDEELREFLDISKRWSEDASRIAGKRMQIGQKQLDLSASMTDEGRDLRTVEQELSAKMEQKDELGNKINLLNRETTKLNSLLVNLSKSATAADKLAREKEVRYATERKGAERKAELVELLKGITNEEKTLQDQIAPLRKKIAAKKNEQQRMRSLGEEEEEKLSKELAAFTAEGKELRNIASKIDVYEHSSAPDEHKRIASKIVAIHEKIAKKEKDAEDLQPRLDETKNAVQDQDRHQKQLVQNIEIVEAGKRIVELNQQIDEIKSRCDEIEGHDTAMDLFLEAKKRREEQQELKYRTEGRFSELVEQIRSVKRKLSASEYRNVDEQCRSEMIKYDTTVLAAEDLKKYYTAVDKALLLFHGIKIQEINKIIRELWLMTYKGGDITNIEIVSGQEAGSKAKKSYNYRVVMTKGSSKMDMRGRCSAGQRVLACIVIRLALAETFGVNCGCIALDEPTVNLDYRNKKGLAVALAQIVASRAQQRNFQLIMITHDEDFVSIMKNELSTLTGFSMPEKYFQVRREEGIDGKFYSKIDAVDFSELT